MDAALKQYMDRHQSLFWYTPKNKLYNVSDDLLVETILNYGTMEDIKELFSLKGINQVKKIFFSAKERMKGNYYPEIYNFFKLVFTKYA